MILDYLHVSLLMMRTKPVRSALSILGIYIGVLALVIILAIQEGARRQIEDLYRVEGARIYIVMPSFDEATMKMGSLLPADAARLSAIRGVQSAMPRLVADKDVRGPEQAIKAQLMGVDAAFIPIYRIPLLTGRNFLEFEVATRQPVCILTDSGKHKLFPLREAVGQSLEIQGDALEIIGIARWSTSISQRAFIGNDPDVLVPSGWLYQSREMTAIPMMEVRADPAMAGEEAVRQIRKVLSHGDAHRAKLYTIESMEEYLRGSQESSARILRGLLAIAGISLLVGAIGVANVMLTTVTERTREIGVRKALGARRHDVLLQFLVEASVLTATGGGLAVLSGLLGVALYPVFFHTHDLLVVPGLPVAGCFLLTFLIGLLAGAYPASRAASLSPAEALRYE